MHSFAIGLLAISVVSAVGRHVEEDLSRRLHGSHRVHRHVRRHSDLTKRTEEGILYTTCLVTQNDGSVQPERCQTTSPYGDMDVGCYTAFTAGGVALRQGCHIAQDVSLEYQCRRQRCASNVADAPMGVHFCCCWGEECNRNFQVDHKTRSLATNNV